MSGAKEAGGQGETEKGKQPPEQKSRTLTTRQPTETQPALLAADVFKDLEVKEVVDKMRLPAVVRLRRSFWRDTRNGTEKAKRQFVLRQLAALTDRWHIITLM